MKVLVINPGATSTKVAVFDEETQVYKTTVDHSPQELDRFDRVIDQADYRQQAILDAVAQSGFRLSDFDAVCGRGGLYRPIPSGTYAVNDRVMHDVETAPYGEHPSNLGAYLARRIGDMVGVPAFFVDPVCVDELTEVAHYTGFAPFRRLSQFHALNQKSIGRKAAAALGKPYEEADLIVCHLGGGVSVAAHHNGRIVDLFNVKDEGSMGMDRAGGLPVNQLISFCFSGRSQDEVKKILGRQGKPYEEADLIVCHLGGGVSVAAHHNGRIVDLFNVKDEGSMGMDRAGGLPVNQLISFCFSGRSQDEVKKILGRQAGMFSYLGTTDFRVICARVKEGDPKFTEAYQALVYQLAKDVGAMAAVLRFHVDAIAYTGGMAYEQSFCDDITAYVGGLAPVLRFPGEEEMRSLAEGALRVLHGQAQPREY